MSDIREINAEKLRKILEENKKTILLDCRSSEKYRREHIPGAVNLTLTFLNETYRDIIPDKTTLIITSCDSFLCTTSARCYEKLKALGYRNLLEYSGGLADWKANGYQTEK